MTAGACQVSNSNRVMQLWLLWSKGLAQAVAKTHNKNPDCDESQEIDSFKLYIAKLTANAF
jgi:hypothetical protein